MPAPPGDAADRGAAGPLPEYLSPAEFARATTLSVTTVRRLLAAGRLPYAQPAGHGGRVLIPRAALKGLAGDRPAEAAPAARPPKSAPASPPIAGPRPRWRAARA